MKSFSLKSAQISRHWYVLDASEVPLGRLATKAASLLIGKSKPTVTPHVDNGDFVVIVNAADLVVTGTKSIDKIYYRHSQYPGGIKSARLEEKMAKDPPEVVYAAVRGMIPVNKLRAGRLQRLKIYVGPDHAHEAQQPEKLSLKAGK